MERRRMHRSLQFEYEETEYTVKEFFLKYKDDLPQVVMVTQGYCGDTGMDTIDKGQAIRIQTYSRQKRLVAQVLKGEEHLNSKKVTIPVDYNVRFHVIKQSKKRSSKDYPLREIIDKHSLPVVVEHGSEEASRDASGRGLRWGTRSFTLQLTDMYEEIYLLGNPVTETHIYDRRMAVPVYLKSLRLSVIHGMKGYSSEWSYYMKALGDRVHQHVQFNKHFGNEDIAVYDDHNTDVSVQTYVEPREYTEISMTLRRKQSGHLYEKMEAPKKYEVIFPSAKVTPPMAAKEECEPLESRYAPFPSEQQKRENLEKGRKRNKTIPQPGQLRKGPPPLPPKRHPSKSLERSLSVDTLHKGDFHLDGADERSQSKPVDLLQGETKKAQIKETVVYKDLQIDRTDLHLQDSDKQNETEHQSLPELSAPIIENLSTTEVCQWLERLHLGKYRPVFEENMIDGSLLVDLTEDILTSEFDMKKFEAIKLRKFAHEGYIPKR